jgi:AcrR family transcriptional regulator
MSVAEVSRKRLGRAERRRAIIDAATSAFATGGYAATSMADIASAARVSHLIVYRHFESKERLYEAVLERAGDALTRALSVEGATGRYGPTTAALLAAARADVGAFRVLWRHAAREAEFAHYADKARNQVLELTAAALGPIVAAAHARWATRATTAYVIDAVLVWVEDGDSRLDARFVAATEASLRAGVRSWAKPS